MTWSILGVTLFIVIIDGFIFRSMLSPSYVSFYTSSQGGRTLAMCILAAIEEIKFRLIVMTTLIALLTLWRGKLSPPFFIVAIVAAQFANVANAMIDQPIYSGLRYLAVGSVWGWLYWKHGWLSAFAGHTGCHLVLDPVLIVVLMRA